MATEIPDHSKTAVPNITVALGETITLTSANTLSVDTITYAGDFVIENGQLTKYLFDKGYFTFSNGQAIAHYYIQDHQGNIRAVVDGDNHVEQINHYYPFGAVYSDAGTNDALQRYKYNGKELDRMHGLNQYDYGARNYDPLLCQFTQIDPLCEKYYDLNPYAYCGNNPVNRIDPDGKDYDVYYDGESFTISATYYTDENSALSATNAVAFWNDLNGQYTMDGFPVNFELNVTVVSSEEIPAGVKAESVVKGNANVTESGNTYLLSDIPEANKNGVTQSGRVVTVDKERATPLTGAHEIGHTIGLQHSNTGVMTAASSNSNRSGKVNKGEIKNIIKNAIKGKPSKDADGNPAGKGHFHNTSDDPNAKFKFKMGDNTK